MTCTYAPVYGGELWCDAHDSAYPCPGGCGPGDPECDNPECGVHYECAHTSATLVGEVYRCDVCGEVVDV